MQYTFKTKAKLHRRLCSRQSGALGPVGLTKLMGESCNSVPEENLWLKPVDEPAFTPS